MHALAITEQGAALHAEGDTLLVRRGAALLRRVRVNEIDQVLLFGRVELSSGAVALLARRGVDVVWATQSAKFRARLATRFSKNVALRLAQYGAVTDEQFCLRAARAIVTAKIRHQREILLRAQRRLQDERLAGVLGQLRLLCDRAPGERGLDALRGVEGQAAALYFSQFDKLILAPGFEFNGRNRRPPRDPVNACLSFGYAVFGSIIETEILRCGLDPFLGVFHQAAYGRASLMLDLLEEFRPVIDGLVLRLINRRQLAAGDFDRLSGQSLEDILGDDATPPDHPAVAPGDSATGGFFDDLAVDEPFDAPPAPPPAVEPAPVSAPGAPAHAEPPAARPEYGVFLGETGRRIFLAEFFKRMRETLFYPPRQSSFELRDILREQVYHFARVIDGRDPDYTPFMPS